MGQAILSNARLERLATFKGCLTSIFRNRGLEADLLVEHLQRVRWRTLVTSLSGRTCWRTVVPLLPSHHPTTPCRYLHQECDQ